MCVMARPLLIESLDVVNMGITAIIPERGDVNRIVDVLREREVIPDATTKQ